MKRLLATTALAVAIAMPAWAIGSYDPSYPTDVSASQHQHQTQGQVQQQSVRNVNKVTINQPAADPATTKAATTAPSSDPSNAGRGGGGGGRTVIGQAPDVLIPSIGGGGADCPVVGFGVGGSGLAGGGGFGPSWISGDCNARKLAELLAELGHRDAAVALLREHFSEVDKAMGARQDASSATPISAVATPLPTAADALHGTAGTNSFCDGNLSLAERRKYAKVCGK